MTSLLCDLKATDAYLGLQIRRIFFSPVSVLLYVLVTSPFALHVYRGGAPEALLMSVFLILFSLHILKGFRDEVLEDLDAQPLSDVNLGGLLTPDVVRAFKGHLPSDPHAFLKGMLKTRRGVFFLQEIGLSPKQLFELVFGRLPETIDVAGEVLEGRELLTLTGETRIAAPILLYVFFNNMVVCESILNEQDLSLDDLKNMLRFEAFHEKLLKQWKPWYHPDSLLKSLGAAGRSWVMGYARELDRLTEDLGIEVRLHGEHGMVIHQTALRDILHVFERSAQHNVLILGPNGAGKRTLARHAAARIRRREIDEGLPYTRILKLRTEVLVSGTQNPDAVLLKALSQLTRKERVLLVIEDFALLLKASNANLKGVVTKMLSAPFINVIGIVDTADYHALIKTDPGMDATFEKIQVEDSSDEETMLVLLEHYTRVEKDVRISVTYKALQSIVELAKRYVGKGAFPGKAIDVVEDALLATSRKSQEYVKEEEIREAISIKAHMDVKGVSDDEREKLIRLEAALTKKIIGQDEAVRGVVHALKRARLEIGGGDRPLGTFLFLGPTGVGKTHTAKTIADIYFGDDAAFVRLDMNEYSTEASIEGIVGTAQAEGGFLTQRVQDRPFSLILLDEIEKANPKVLNLFLQVLDEGFLTDERGIKTDFRNTIFIATSNAGALFIRDYVRGHPDWNRVESHAAFKDALVNHILEQKLFSPEFLNRFDETVVYYPLSFEDAARVAILMLNSIIKEFEEKKGIHLKVEEPVVRAIVDKGYSIEFGAREMRRTIVEMFENYLADYMLKHDVKRGEEIVMRMEDLLH